MYKTVKTYQVELIFLQETVKFLHSEISHNYEIINDLSEQRLTLLKKLHEKELQSGIKTICYN